MKIRLIIFVAICTSAGLLGWYLNRPAVETPAKPAEQNTVEKPIALKPPTINAPTRPAQVEQPVVAAAKPSDTPTPMTLPAEDTFVAEPQADLKMCVATTLHFLETQDITSLVKTIMPPDEINKMIQAGQASSVEDVAEHYRQMPDVASRMNQLLQALQSVQDQEPQMSADGKEAVYQIDPGAVPPNGPGNNGDIHFIQVDGFWYLR